MALKVPLCLDEKTKPILPLLSSCVGVNDYRLIIALYVFSVSYNRQSTEQDFLNFIKQNYSFFELFYLFIILNLAFLKFSMFSLY